MGESTHGGDRLVGQIVFSGCVVLDNLALAGVDTTTDTVNLFVQLGTMMVTLLTSTGNRELDTRRMPSSDTGDLTQTFVGLAGQLACVRREVTPLNPLPLVTPMTSIISFWAKTDVMGTGFSKCCRAQSTFWAIVPPLTWISIM